MSRYTCHKCQSEYSTENMVCVCAVCVNRLEIELSAALGSLELCQNDADQWQAACHVAHGSREDQKARAEVAEKREADKDELIRQHCAHWNAVGVELGGCFGGVDVPVSRKHSNAYVVIEKIKSLKSELAQANAERDEWRERCESKFILPFLGSELEKKFNTMEQDLTQANEKLAKARTAWDDFLFRLVNAYGGPTPYLRIEEMDAALASIQNEKEK